MSHRSFCNQQPWSAVTKLKVSGGFLFLGLCLVACASRASAGDAPPWMHTLSSAALPAHDEKTDAILMYSETDMVVLSVDKVRTHVRQAYKILRPGGRDYGTVVVYFGAREKVNSYGWCIPEQGKDYEVKGQKDSTEVAIPKVDGSELISDLRAKVLAIPAAYPGNIVGYEYDVEEQPLILGDIWRFQHKVPVRESHYSLQVPPGWQYKATWRNHPELKPTASGAQQQWVVNDIKPIRIEEDMPPFKGLAGQMIVSFFPPSGPAANGFTNWQEMGTWYQHLTTGRENASPEIKLKVAALTASVPRPVDKMRALALFVQHDVRYVAIELGIGGYQPHPAGDIFQHRYGD